MENVVEHILCGPTNKEVYAYRDWVDRYMTEMETPKFTGSVEISGVAIEERANLRFWEFFRGMSRFGGMTEQSFEEFVQLMIAWLIRGIQMDFCVRTRQIGTLGRGCSTSYKLVGELREFTFHRQVQGRFTLRYLVDIRFVQQGRLGPTHSTTLMHSLTLSDHVIRLR